MGLDEYPASDWLGDIPELNNRRAPGNTCMSALRSLYHNEQVRNDSKGCGGVMRVAPIAFLPPANNSVEDVGRLAVEAVALTHKHPLGFLPAAVMVHIISDILNGNDVADYPVLLDGIVDSALKSLKRYSCPEAGVLEQLIRKAVSLSAENMDDVTAICQLGEGWTGDEALAIAIYCSLKYRSNFEHALIAAVNHSGDSDSTGAITGNIVGAVLGRNAIPPYYTEKLELLSVIEKIANEFINI
jgi:ADP-ribosylglycohydrolase